jgi:hypothetical protein
VNNRNYPWGGRTIDNNEEYFNWTRWRVTRDAFQGFKDTKLTLTQPFPPVFECLPQGDYVPSVDEVSGCSLYYDKDGVATIAPRIINLHHTWQTEAKFPFDYDRAYKFTYTPPPGGTAYQKEVAGILSDPVFGTQADPGGWPYGPLQSGYDDQCCPDPGDPGIAWDDDGHGEIVGFRGPVSGDLLSVVWLNAPIPLGVRVRTSPWCVSCPSPEWPARFSIEGSDKQLSWSDTPLNQESRAELMRELESGSLGAPGFAASWKHRPYNPDLCLVSDELIALFGVMNRPPHADAGDDRTLECAGGGGADVLLDGSGSSDPDATDDLAYLWTWPAGSATGKFAAASLPLGVHCITLRVTDPSGHIDEDVLSVTVADTTPPDLTVVLSPTLLWPPNHKLVDIAAAVEAEDGCGEVASLTLVSITSSDADDGKGDGHTTGDIAGAVPGTLDTAFQLRAEFSGIAGQRVYTVTYQATDASGNRAEVSAEVLVKHPGP